MILNEFVLFYFGIHIKHILTAIFEAWLQNMSPRESQNHAWPAAHGFEIPRAHCLNHSSNKQSIHVYISVYYYPAVRKVAKDCTVLLISCL